MRDDTPEDAIFSRPMDSNPFGKCDHDIGHVRLPTGSE